MTDKTDIVIRLRGLWQDNDCTSTLMDQAADEIERLRRELGQVSDADSAERDEARREVCVAREALIRLMTHGNVAVPQEAMHQAAKARGWNCFKENTDD